MSNVSIRARAAMGEIRLDRRHASFDVREHSDLSLVEEAAKRLQ